MIFQHTLPEIMTQKKTQTRRLVQPDEIAFTGLDNEIIAVVKNGRRIYRVGRKYPIMPGRGKPTVRIALDTYGQVLAWTTGGELYGFVWYPAYILLLGIRCQQVQEISEADAIAEGVASVAEYCDLWNTIHRRPGTRWSDNPWVWVYSFELVLPRRKTLLDDTSLESVWSTTPD